MERLALLRVTSTPKTKLSHKPINNVFLKSKREYHPIAKYQKVSPFPVDEKVGIWDEGTKQRYVIANNLWYGRLYDFWNNSPYDPPRLFHKSVLEYEELYQDDCPVGRSKLIYMNRSKDLNSFNLHFVSRLRSLFEKYGKQKETSYGTWIRGRGDNFSSGTDYLELYKKAQYPTGQNVEEISEFFNQLYNLSNVLHNSEVPSYFINDGLTLGSAASCSIVSQSNVATENTIMAWPETELGYFPDAGATWKLSRLPCHIGTYLALTGCRIEGQNAVHAGLAKYAMDPFQSSHLRWDFEDLPERNKKLRALFFSFHELDAVPFALEEHLKTIDKCFSKNTMEEIIDALKYEAEVEENEWAEKKLNILLKKSPLSLKITLRLLREAKPLTLYDCLHKEYNVAHNLILDSESDFHRGVRALVLNNTDPYKSPNGIKVNWKHKSINDVKEEEVDFYFQKHTKFNIKPLQIDTPRLSPVQEAMKIFNREKRVADLERSDSQFVDVIHEAHCMTPIERCGRVVKDLERRLSIGGLTENQEKFYKESVAILKKAIKYDNSGLSQSPSEIVTAFLSEAGIQCLKEIINDESKIDNAYPIYDNPFLYESDEIITDKSIHEEYEKIINGDYYKYQSPYDPKTLPTQHAEGRQRTHNEIMLAKAADQREYEARFVSNAETQQILDSIERMEDEESRFSALFTPPEGEKPSEDEIYINEVSERIQKGEAREFANEEELDAYLEDLISTDKPTQEFTNEIMNSLEDLSTFDDARNLLNNTLEKRKELLKYGDKLNAEVKLHRKLMKVVSSAESEGLEHSEFKYNLKRELAGGYPIERESTETQEEDPSFADDTSTGVRASLRRYVKCLIELEEDPRSLQKIIDMEKQIALKKSKLYLSKLQKDPFVQHDIFDELSPIDPNSVFGQCGRRSLFEDELPPEIYELSAGERVVSKYNPYNFLKEEKVKNGIWDPKTFLDGFEDIDAVASTSIMDTFLFDSKDIDHTALRQQNNLVMKKRRTYRKDNRWRDSDNDA